MHLTTSFRTPLRDMEERERDIVVHVLLRLSHLLCSALSSSPPAFPHLHHTTVLIRPTMTQSSNGELSERTLVKNVKNQSKRIKVPVVLPLPAKWNFRTTNKTSTVLDDLIVDQQKQQHDKTFLIGLICSTPRSTPHTIHDLRYRQQALRSPICHLWSTTNSMCQPGWLCL